MNCSKKISNRIFDPIILIMKELIITNPTTAKDLNEQKRKLQNNKPILSHRRNHLLYIG